MNELVLILAVFCVACVYSMVGHGGASGYLALLALAGASVSVMKPTALVLNLCVSLIAFGQFLRAGHFQWRTFWPFAMLSVPAAFVGAGIELDAVIYKRALGVCIVIAGARLLGLFSKDPGATRPPPLSLGLVIGGLIGLLSGLLGIGGGILLSPVLLMCRWADAKSAAATSSLFIFVNSAAGLLNVQWTADILQAGSIGLIGAAVLGGTLGSWLGAKRTPEPRLRQALGTVMVLASIKLIWP